MQQKNEYGFRKINRWLAFLMLLLALAVGYYIAAGAEAGGTIFTWYANMEEVLCHPLKNYWNAYSIRGMLFSFICYVLGGLYYLTSAHNYMQGKEYGTSKYGNVKKINKELADLNNAEEDENNVVVICRRKKGIRGLLGKKDYIVLKS